jgi:hypothetical protein
MYWDSSFPRLVTCAQAKDLALEKRLPLIGVCDITCDLHGSVEFLTVSCSSCGLADCARCLRDMPCPPSDLRCGRCSVSHPCVIVRAGSSGVHVH